jgi:hypothetical protein
VRAVAARMGDDVAEVVDGEVDTGSHRLYRDLELSHRVRRV